MYVVRLGRVLQRESWRFRRLSFSEGRGCARFVCLCLSGASLVSLCCFCFRSCTNKGRGGQGIGYFCKSTLSVVCRADVRCLRDGGRTQWLWCSSAGFFVRIFGCCGSLVVLLPVSLSAGCCGAPAKLPNGYLDQSVPSLLLPALLGSMIACRSETGVSIQG